MNITEANSGAISAAASTTSLPWWQQLLVSIFAVLGSSWTSGPGTSGTDMMVTRQGTFALLETVPHDPTAFTQGLVALSDQNNKVLLYEGTGLYGQSEIRQVDLKSGSVIQSHALSNQYFGEGITYFTENGQGRLLQLTWKSKTGFVYDSSTLDPLGKFSFTTTNNEGWGITTTPNYFVVSDGSSYLHLWSKSTLKEVRKVQVKMRKQGSSSTSIQRINEIEWDSITNTVLANVWFRDIILRIDLETGFVQTIYDLANLFPVIERPASADVLNGIALVPNSPGQIWVTGE